jgi:nitroimidazol reductase NimA-like FMN-containing flavoprotein (pyridoxamine 5'-phosphate oxidase superfamily)
MRRNEKEITDMAEIKKILGSAKYMTLAMCENNIPYLVSLSHGYDVERNCLYFHCAPEGKKKDILESHNEIWGQVIMDLGYVHGKCDQLYASVHFQGRVVFVKDISEKRHALEIMIKQLEKNPEQVIFEQLGDESVRKVTVGRIDVAGFFGKKSKDIILSL